MRHFGDLREGHSDEESKNVLRILLQYSLYPSIAPYLIPEKRTIFLDFDGTLTVRDTCVRDSVCAYSKDVGLRGNELFFKDSLDRQALYQELLAAYKSTYQGQFDALLQNDTLSGFLKGYDAIDYDCLKPCEDSGCSRDCAATPWDSPGDWSTWRRTRRTFCSTSGRGRCMSSRSRGTTT